METNLAKLLEQTRAEFEKAEALHKEAAKDLMAVRRVMRLAHPDYDEHPDPLPEMDITHGNLRSSDLTDCMTSQEAVMKMAQDNNGVLMALPAAKMLVEVGLSKSKPNDLAANITRKLNASDKWELVGPSMFRIVSNN